MNKVFLAAALMMTVAAPTAEASLLRLDFAGEIVDYLPSIGGITPMPISGFLLIDSAVPDIRPEPDDAHYDNAVIGGEVLWDGIALDYVPSAIFSDVFIRNDDAGGFNDLFAAIGTFVDPNNGINNVIGLQLGDITRTVFSDDSFPTSLSLSMFDPWQLDNASGTGIFIVPFDGTDISFQGGFTFAELSAIQVPGPGTAGLFVATLLAWRAARRRR